MFRCDLCEVDNKAEGKKQHYEVKRNYRREMVNSTTFHTTYRDVYDSQTEKWVHVCKGCIEDEKQKVKKYLRICSYIYMPIFVVLMLFAAINFYFGNETLGKNIEGVIILFTVLGVIVFGSIAAAFICIDDIVFGSASEKAFYKGFLKDPKNTITKSAVESIKN